MPRRKEVVCYEGSNIRFIGHQIDGDRYLSLKHFCYRYKKLEEEYDDCFHISSSPPDGMPKGKNKSNPTEKNGEKAVRILRQIEAINQAAIEVGGVNYQQLIYSVTHKDITYSEMQLIRNLDWGRNKYYKIRYNFFCVLDIFLEVGIQGTK